MEGTTTFSGWRYTDTIGKEPGDGDTDTGPPSALNENMGNLFVVHIDQGTKEDCHLLVCGNRGFFKSIHNFSFYLVFLKHCYTV